MKKNNMHTKNKFYLELNQNNKKLYNHHYKLINSLQK